MMKNPENRSHGSEPPGTDHLDVSTGRHCPNFQAAIELIGRRWNGAILFAASHGAHRYREFLSSIPGLSERLLAQRLRELEDAELIERTVTPTIPVQVRYSLTTRGRELVDAIQPIAAWADRWLNDSVPADADADADAAS